MFDPQIEPEVHNYYAYDYEIHRMEVQNITLILCIDLLNNVSVI